MIQLAQMSRTPSADLQSAASPAEDVLSLFVSDLAPYATEEDLRNVFSFPLDHLPGDALGRLYIYPFCVTDIRMVSNPGNGSKYAFVRFPSIAERTRALYIMQGVLCLGRPIRLSRAHAKERVRDKTDLVLFTNNRNKEERQRDNIVIDQFNSQWASVDPKNTKVFVGGISPRVQLHEIVNRFGAIGMLTNVNFGKGCAFISYARKSDATVAIERLDGMVMDGKSLRVTWSRSSVQPLLQQQRTLVTAGSPPSSQGSTPETRYATYTPSSPRSPVTPITPFGPPLFPQVAGATAKIGFRPQSRSGSISSKASMTPLPSLYPVHEVEEGNSGSLLEYAPALARRRTVANVARHRAGLLDQEEFSFKGIVNRPVEPAPADVLAQGMGRRVSLPGNAL
ncbi:hypothetical protein FRC14_003010 [Serendipita sp. 396]|nr:hypothetical protein FRC14_003010 [Serendipita sp. 396]KAG8788525.1 hypothetical protein FRC15_003853 [Serendipita sp. 397]KAG8824385.1 hypothetical protein FRC19_001901 [Serendipita sp. 401]KAG8859637.1 hypothetical protein FRB91_007292 [Serendipita sp. 411]KAG8875021.1 hypothetical protein FRC20_004739 [Serendipita sp. 405]KAG9056034.1 hypothetical protein FS842_000478 [Serendipita sp. 407]